MRKLVRSVLLFIALAIPCVWQAWIGIEISQRLKDQNRTSFAIIDMQVRIFHHVVGHDGKVGQCRECMKEVHEYLDKIGQDFPGTFLED